MANSKDDFLGLFRKNSLYTFFPGYKIKNRWSDHVFMKRETSTKRQEAGNMLRTFLVEDEIVVRETIKKDDSLGAVWI